MGILCDVLVRVENFIFPVDFVILDCEIDFEVSIIFGRPILSIGRALVDMKSGKLKFRRNNEKVKFNVCQSIKQLRYISVVSAIEEEVIEVLVKERLAAETVVAVIMNFDGEFIEEYEETANALQ